MATVPKRSYGRKRKAGLRNGARIDGAISIRKSEERVKNVRFGTVYLRYYLKRVDLLLQFGYNIV